MTQRVLVTGSSRGIGKAIAVRLAQSGFDIALHFHANRAAAEASAAEICCSSMLPSARPAAKSLRPTSKPTVPITAWFSMPVSPAIRLSRR